MPRRIEFGHQDIEKEPSVEVESDKTFIEALYTTAVSVKDLIPGINMEGLTAKSSLPVQTAERGVVHYCDEDEDRKLYHLPHELATVFAGLLYLEELTDAEKKELENPEKEKALAKLRKEIKHAFEGQIVVDMAAGENTFGYRIVDQAKAKSYVALEPAFGFDLSEELTYLLNPGTEDKRGCAKPQQERDRMFQKLNKIPVAVVEEDMLSFLKRLPPNSVSIWCSGIDINILPDPNYREAVSKEIVRVLHPRGAYVGQSKMSIPIPESFPGVRVSFAGEKKKDSFSGKEEATHSSVNIYRKAK